MTGALGRAVAESLTLSLGLGAYVLAAFPVAWGIACLRGRPPASWGRKALMVPVLAGLAAILAALLVRKLAAPGLWRSGPGGYLGVAFGQVIFRIVGRAASLFVAFLAVAALLLTTDLRIGLLFGAKASRRAPGRARKSRALVETDGRGRRGPRRGRTADEDEGARARRARGRRTRTTASWSRARATGDGAVGRRRARRRARRRRLRRPRRGRAVPRLRRGGAPRGDGQARPPRPSSPARSGSPRPPGRRSPAPYEFPPNELLERGEPIDPELVRGEIDRNAAVLASTLRSFGIETRVVSSGAAP